MRNNSTAATKTSGPRLSLYERRRTVWAVIAGLLAVNLILVFFTLRPSGLSLSQQYAELSRLQTERENRRATVANLERLQASLEASRKQSEEFLNTKFLPAATGFSKILEELDKLAVTNNVRKGPVSYSDHEIKDRPGIQTIEMNLQLVGDYPKIVRFINQLEQSPLFLMVDSLGVSRGEGRAVQLSVKLVTYFRSEKGTTE